MSRARGRWPLQMDIRLCGPIYWVVLGIELGYPVFLLRMQMSQVIPGKWETYPFTLSMTPFGTLNTNAGEWMQLALPLMIGFCVLLLFANHGEGHSGEYLYSLPASRLFLTLGRWGRLMLTLLPGYLLDVWACWKAGNQLLEMLGDPTVVPLRCWLLNCLPCVIFLAGAALLVVVAGKKLVYGVLLVAGLVLVDWITLGFLLDQATFLLGSFGRETSLEQVLWNRGIYTALGLLMALVAQWISSAKWYRRRL